MPPSAQDTPAVEHCILFLLTNGFYHVSAIESVFYNVKYTTALVQMERSLPLKISQVGSEHRES